MKSYHLKNGSKFYFPYLKNNKGKRDVCTIGSIHIGPGVYVLFDPPTKIRPGSNTLRSPSFRFPRSALSRLSLLRSSAMAAAALARLCRKTVGSSTASRFLSTSASPAAAMDRVRWDYRGQRRVIPLGQWVPKIAVDAYVAPNVVLAGQVTVCDGASVWNGSVLRGDLNKITVGFSSNVQERCVLHAAWNSPTGP